MTMQRLLYTLILFNAYYVYCENYTYSDNAEIRIVESIGNDPILRGTIWDHQQRRTVVYTQCTQLTILEGGELSMGYKQPLNRMPLYVKIVSHSPTTEPVVFGKLANCTVDCLYRQNTAVSVTMSGLYMSFVTMDLSGKYIITTAYYDMYTMVCYNVTVLRRPLSPAIGITYIHKANDRCRIGIICRARNMDGWLLGISGSTNTGIIKSDGNNSLLISYADTRISDMLSSVVCTLSSNEYTAKSEVLLLGKYCSVKDDAMYTYIDSAATLCGVMLKNAYERAITQHATHRSGSPSTEVQLLIVILTLNLLTIAVYITVKTIPYLFQHIIPCEIYRPIQQEINRLDLPPSYVETIYEDMYDDIFDTHIPPPPYPTEEPEELVV